jgi:serine/threonine protein kinase/tetratricopeptide (TPR) repeat protein
MSQASDVEALLFAALEKPTAAERAAFLDSACAGDAELRRQVERLLQAHAEAGAFLQKPVVEQLAAVEPPPAAHDKPGNIPDRPPADPGQTVDSDPGPAGDPATGEHVPEPAAGPLRLPRTTDYRPLMEPGVVIAGRFTLQQKLGVGGMGEVWVARQTEPVKRKVALKLIKAGMDSRAVLSRFEQERQALALMDHPNIARVLDGGLTPTGQPFFVMELVNGLPLHRFCDEAKLTPRERLELFVPICQAVQHAHQKGIVHRDLKPTNILVTLIDGRPVPKVIDFGVAKATAGKLTDESMSTQFGAVIGTLEYMAPEQAGFAGEDIDTRADIYSLGVILYELLTGLKPLDARRLRKAALAEVVRIIQQEEPSRPSTRLSTDEALPSLAALRKTEPKRLTALLRGELDWVVMRCLEKQRDRRYETANGLARDVQRYLADEPVEARPPSAGYRLRKFLKRNKGPVVAVSLLVLALLAGILGTTWGLIEARQQEHEARHQERLAREEAEDKERARQDEATQRAIAEAQKVKAEQAAEAEKAARTQAQKRLSQIEKANAILGSIFDNLDPREIAQAQRPLQAILVEKLDQAVAQLEGEAIGDSLVVAEMQTRFGFSLMGLGAFDKAIVLQEKALATHRAELGPDHPKTLRSMNNLAGAYQFAGKPDRALPLLDATLKGCQARFGPDSPETLSSMNNLATAYLDTGKLDRALPLLEQALKLMNAKLGPDHPETLSIMNNLATAYLGAGRSNLAVPLFEQALKLMKARFGPEHPNTLTCMNNLAKAYMDVGKLDRAQPLLEQALKVMNAKLGPDHPTTLAAANNVKFLRNVLSAEDRYRAKLAESGPKDINTLLAHRDLAQMYMTKNQLDAAELILAEVLQGMRDGKANDALVMFTTQLLGRCLGLRQRAAPDAWTTSHAKSLLGGALLDQKKYAQAEPLLVQGYEGMKAREAEIPPQAKFRLLEAVERLVQLYEATDRKDKATRWRTEQESYTAQRAGPVHEVGTGLKLNGQLDAETTALVYQVRFVAGKIYVIDMVSPDQKALDPYLVLSGAAGKKLAEDNDGGGGFNARITFQAEQDGTYRIRTTSLKAGRGDFTLTVREQPKPPKGEKH